MHFKAGAFTAGARASGTLTLTVARSTEAEVAALRQEVDALKAAQAEDAADFKRQLAAQGEELREHAVSVTRQGWQYIVWGATCSAFGTFLALVADAPMRALCASPWRGTV